MQIRNNIAISDSGFVFDATSGESFTLNKIGLDILHMLKEEIVDEEIANKILEKYEVDANQFEKDFFDFVGMLRHFNLFDNNAS